MTEQRDLFAVSVFELRIGELQRELGIKRASEIRPVLLELARLYVKRAALARDDRTATADDAARGFEAAGYPADVLGNAAGALFRGPGWVFTGLWQKSARVTNHAHQNRVWRWVDG